MIFSLLGTSRVYIIHKKTHFKRFDTKFNKEWTHLTLPAFNLHKHGFVIVFTNWSIVAATPTIKRKRRENKNPIGMTYENLKGVRN